MKPFAIRKCPDCGMWHIWRINIVGPFVIPEKAFTATTFEDILIVLNFGIKRLIEIKKIEKSGRYGQ